jgi:hypothetical protein
MRLVEGAYYVTAASITTWGLLVMLRGQLPDDADGLWVVSFAHDMWQGVPLRGWRVPGAPIYFPELFSVLVSAGLGFGIRWSMLIHGACSWMLMGLGIYWGVRQGRVSPAQALRVAFLALLVYLLLYCESRLLQPFEYPFSHGGAALVSFFGLLYLGHGLERGFGLPTWLIALACLGLSCASDRVILAQFVAPALFVVLLLFALRSAARRRLFWALGLLILGPLLGVLLSMLIHWGFGIGSGRLSGLVRSGGILLRLLDDMQQLAVEQPSIAASVLLPVLYLCWRATAAVRQEVRSRRPGASEGSSVRVEHWLAGAGLAVVLSTLAAVVATSRWDGPASFRYLLPVFLFPPALAIILAAPSYSNVTSGRARLLELTLLFVLVLVGVRTERLIPRQRSSLLSPARSCLDSYLKETGLRAGYAEYWSARPQMLLGQAGVTLAQVTGRLAPKVWADNRFWYTRGFSPEHGRPRFSFVVTKALDQGWLGARFGPPHVEHQCFGLEAWVYDRPEDVEFRNYLRGAVALATGDDPDWWSVSGPMADDEGESRPVKLTFSGKTGAFLPMPHVHANVIEIASPTRKPLLLSYRQQGTEVGVQEVTFLGGDQRRLLILPARLDLRNVDSLFISGKAKDRHELKWVALMWDPEAESARR